MRFEMEMTWSKIELMSVLISLAKRKELIDRHHTCSVCKLLRKDGLHCASLSDQLSKLEEVKRHIEDQKAVYEEDLSKMLFDMALYDTMHFLKNI